MKALASPRNSSRCHPRASTHFSAHLFGRTRPCLSPVRSCPPEHPRHLSRAARQMPNACAPLHSACEVLLKKYQNSALTTFPLFLRFSCVSCHYQTGVGNFSHAFTHQNCVTRSRCMLSGWYNHIPCYHRYPYQFSFKQCTSLQDLLPVASQNSSAAASSTGEGLSSQEYCSLI